MAEKAVDKHAEEDELFLVDCGIESLANIYLQLPSLKSLNLHSNYIEVIQNLTAVPQLTYLDLSSNQIKRVEGLNYVPLLQHLNLACNQITIIEGLSKLRSLISLNLSYNQLADVSGLRHLPEGNCLEILQLQGNRLSDLRAIISATRRLHHLTCLVLEDGSSSTNPVCADKNYKRQLYDNIPSLKTVNKPLANQMFSEGADFTSSEHRIESRAESIQTPRIDAVLDKFHRVADCKQSSEFSSNLTTSTPEALPDTEKAALEEKLASLEKELLHSRIEKMEDELKKLKEKPSQDEVRIDQKNVKVVTVCKQPDKTVRGAGTTSSVKQSNIPKKVKSNSQSTTRQLQTTNEHADIVRREAVSSTYNQILKDLKMEQGRRIKAEEATSKLLQEISSLKSAASEHVRIKQNCDDALRSLQKKVNEHDEVTASLNEEITSHKETCNRLKIELKESKHVCCNQEKALARNEEIMKEIEASGEQMEVRKRKEKERLEKLLAEQTDTLHTAQATVRSQKADLEEMRALLAARESEHRRDLETRYTLDSPKLEELFTSKISNLVRSHDQERREYEEKLGKADKAYLDLEDEFRMALEIEADRFGSLQEAFSKTTDELNTLKLSLSSLQSKDTKSVKMMGDLTQLVKEQKDKLINLSKEKQEQTSKNQALKSKFETQIEDLRSQVKSLDRLKKDNIELKSQVQGQHTVICGLRKERELWGKELAQQGAALSSERGSMEAQISSFTQENSALQSKLNAEVDTVKIKVKVIADLTETVADLKKRLAESDNKLTGYDNQLDALKIQHSKELEDERCHSADLESQVETLTRRKEELKERLGKTESDLCSVQESHRKLKAKWQEKSSSITNLEQQVQAMQAAWKEKETKLTAERDKAIEAGEVAIKKLKVADDAFRKQLDAKEIAHADRLHEMENQYELRLAENQHQMEQIEEEMREILSEKENSRKQFDEKLKHVTKAFIDLQNDLKS